MGGANCFILQHRLNCHSACFTHCTGWEVRRLNITAETAAKKKMKRGEMFCKGRRGERETARGSESGEEGSVPFSSRCRIIQKALQCSLTIICWLSVNSTTNWGSLTFTSFACSLFWKMKVDPFWHHRGHWYWSYVIDKSPSQVFILPLKITLRPYGFCMLKLPENHQFEQNWKWGR